MIYFVAEYWFCSPKNQSFFFCPTSLIYFWYSLALFSSSLCLMAPRVMWLTPLLMFRLPSGYYSSLSWCPMRRPFFLPLVLENLFIFKSNLLLKKGSSLYFYRNYSSVIFNRSIISVSLAGLLSLEHCENTALFFKGFLFLLSSIVSRDRKVVGVFIDWSKD